MKGTKLSVRWVKGILISFMFSSFIVNYLFGNLNVSQAALIEVGSAITTEESTSLTSMTEPAANPLSEPPAEPSADPNFTIAEAAEPPPDTTPPSVTLNSPRDNEFTNSLIIEGQTEPDLPVSVYIDGIQRITVTADSLGYWSYSSQLSDGDHSVYATSTDAAGNAGTSTSHTFTLDTIRPIVLPNLSPVPDMTKVAKDTLIQVKLSDDSPIDTSTISSAIILSGNGSSISGTVSYDSLTKQLTFTPNVSLTLNKKYYVYVSPSLKDMAGNHIHPRSWSFTTESSENSVVENPHGNYTSNVNTCNNCHSTHVGSAPKLTNPKHVSIDQYCTACHDGTAAPLPENWETGHKHDFQVSMDGSTGTSSCTSCHNPHLTWSSENPNSLQDYYKFEHPLDPTNPYQQLPATSEEQLCESCHSPGIKQDGRVLYQRYKNEKRNTSTGLNQDYNLCLRCHNGTNAVDINTYYSDSNTASGHFIQALDGSPLNGHMPCADCHDTHGSPNIKLLKEELGHNNPVDQGKFQKIDGTWDETTTRNFCAKCHNGTTELYGITVEQLSGDYDYSQLIKIAHSP